MSELEFYNFSDMNVISEDPGNDAKHSQIVGIKDLKQDKSDDQKALDELNNRVVEEAKKNAELEKHNAVVDAKLDAIQKSVDEFKERLQNELDDESDTSDDGSSDGDENEEPTEESAESTESKEFSLHIEKDLLNRPVLASFTERLTKVNESIESRNFSLKSDIKDVKSKLENIDKIVNKVEELSSEVSSIKSELSDDEQDEISTDDLINTESESTEQDSTNSNTVETTSVDNENTESDTSDDGSSDGDENEEVIDSSLPANFNKKVKSAFDKKFSTSVPKYVVKYSWDEGVDEFVGTLDECNEFILVNEARVASGEKFDVISGPNPIETTIKNKVSKFAEFSNRLNNLKF